MIGGSRGEVREGGGVMGAVPVRRAWTAEREVVVFFVAAVALLWVLGVPMIAAGLPYLLMALVGASVPLVVAGALTWRAEGSLRRLWRQLAVWRVRPRWYVVPVAVAVAAALAVFGVMEYAGRETTGESFVPWWAIPVALPVFAVLLGGQEEPGWRGFALPRLQQRFSAWSASLIVGAAWAIWHVPMFVFDVVEDVPYLFYALVTVGLSVIYTWLFNSSGGAVTIAMLFHGAWNLSGLWLPSGTFAWATMAVVVWAGAVLLLLVYGAEGLARGGRVSVAATRLGAAPTPPVRVEVG